ncbi:uncharacterized protein LOC135702228 [Ochlerotatus camptorhynchus]|uniref:uncharacterized protein LOC135702228 n=1 Tax=Ochlerotatus camptorhynchus TaxID=644619 RepID=UPI0031DBCFED
MNIDKTLRQFWEVEEINKPKPLTLDEQNAVNMYQATYKREESGRFVVSLPFKETEAPLGESQPAAIHRLKAMQQKFASDPVFKKMYVEFMADYLEVGHMEQIPDKEIDIPSDRRFYFPHHAVLRNNSLTTKLRVVFDGSCKTTTGVSLNDRLLVGPKVTEDVPIVVTRFRTYPVAFKADAEKMYRQVKVRKEEIDYQRIVWSSESEQPLEHYRLLTVTYGSSCAPYLAVESLRQAARDSYGQYPEAAERVLKNFYVDDLLSGADTLEEAVKIRNEIIQITSTAGFNLRKWSSNDPRLFDNNNEANEAVPLHLAPETDPVKALGIQWYPDTDTFGFELEMDFDKLNTKRQMLSDTARLFDPLGWIATIIVRIKILYQSLWLQDFLWDDPLPASINEEWNKIKTSLHEIENIRIPRWTANHGGKMPLLGFADASEAAYAAVVYARSTDEEAGGAAM